MNLKTTTILFLFLACIYGCHTGKVTTALNLKETGKIPEALETINSLIDPANEKAEKTIVWPKTWETRGEIYQAIYNSEDEEVKSLHDNPLNEAFNSYKKALELDTKNKFANSLKIKLTLLTNDFTNRAVEGFNNENYDKALESFEQIIEIGNFDVMKEEGNVNIDTVIMYNAALAAYNAKKYDKAIKYYREAAKYGYNEGRTYSLLANTYQMKKDTLGALEVLKEGFEKYPEDNNILTSMIQIYLDLNKTEDAMKYLNMAIEKDPGNASFHFAQGTLYEKLEDEENAIKSYKKAMEADRNFFNAYYNLGALYYNKGVKQIEVANAVPANQNEKYQAELKKADKWFEEALPYMEKCEELQPDDPMTIESLKNLYYRLKMMDKYNAILEKQGE